MIRRLILGLCTALLPGSPAIAQTDPSKPIRLVVGYSAGGGNDLITPDAVRLKAVATAAGIKLD
ncbi:MAG: hypothetical protein AB7G10_24155 [Reyranellaceae bacterium]